MEQLNSNKNPLFSIPKPFFLCAGSPQFIIYTNKNKKSKLSMHSSNIFEHLFRNTEFIFLDPIFRIYRLHYSWTVVRR